MSVSSTGSNLLQYLVVFASPGLRRRVVSNRAVSVHALPLILSRLLAPPNYLLLQAASPSAVRGEAGDWGLSELFVYTANCSCCFLSLAQAELLGCLTQLSAPSLLVP